MPISAKFSKDFEHRANFYYGKRYLFYGLVTFHPSGLVKSATTYRWSYKRADGTNSNIEAGSQVGFDENGYLIEGTHIPSIVVQDHGRRNLIYLDRDRVAAYITDDTTVATISRWLTRAPWEPRRTISDWHKSTEIMCHDFEHRQYSACLFYLDRHSIWSRFDETNNIWSYSYKVLGHGERDNYGIKYFFAAPDGEKLIWDLDNEWLDIHESHVANGTAEEIRFKIKTPGFEALESPLPEMIYNADDFDEVPEASPW